MVSSSVSTWQTYLKGSRPVPKLFVPGVMQWEMMVGHSQTRWHWGSPVALQSLRCLRTRTCSPDGTPVSFTEAAAIREYTTGKNPDFIAVETCLDETSLNAPEAYLTMPQGSAHILDLSSEGPSCCRWGRSV